MEIDHLMTRGPLVWEVKSVAWLANILLSSSEHLVYEQDKSGNKQQIESPLLVLTGAREIRLTKNNLETFIFIRRKSFVIIKRVNNDLHPGQSVSVCGGSYGCGNNGQQRSPRKKERSPSVSCQTGSFLPRTVQFDSNYFISYFSFQAGRGPPTESWLDFSASEATFGRREARGDDCLSLAIISVSRLVTSLDITSSPGRSPPSPPPLRESDVVTVTEISWPALIVPIISH